MIMLYVPCKDEKSAKELGKKLVEEKLAFCVNVVPRVTSIYFWEGKLQEDAEAVLIVKTNEAYAKVKKRIEELHTYDTPAVLGFKVDYVNEKYGEWSELNEQ